jgi:hypothetical protein
MPHELIHHMDSVLGYSRTFFIGGGSYQPPACSECAEHVRQLEGESPFHNLMEVK